MNLWDLAAAYSDTMDRERTVREEEALRLRDKGINAQVVPIIAGDGYFVGYDIEIRTEAE